MTFTADGSNNSTRAAVEALQRGYMAIPIRAGAKNPHISGWTHVQWESTDQVRSAFEGFAVDGATNVGLLLGKPSGGLIDVDLDHPKALRLRDHLLPPTPMMTGRPGRMRSHMWYRVMDDLPGTRTCKMPDGSMVVELRSTGAQTVIPPSVHPSQEVYRWEKEPWGGESGPAVVSGPVLAAQVALLGLGAVLIHEWPARGARHEAYLALAGGLLRYGDGVHPYWQRNLPVLINAMADATRDEDATGRVAEVMGTTITRLQEKGLVVGFPKLGEIIGNDHAEQARRLAREVEKVGWRGERPPRTRVTPSGVLLTEASRADDALQSTLPPEKRNPILERLSPWAALDMEPYLTGQVEMEPPSILRRSDGKALMYPGRVNSLFGKSESAKSWVALYACTQEMAKGGRILYLDFEDSPEGTIGRLMALGSGADDIQRQFRYVLPDGPISDMQRNKFGSDNSTKDGEAAHSIFQVLLDEFDPTLIVADGMTVLYGLHGQDTNDATGTEIITGWLKRLCRTGATVIVIDHTGKGDGPGSSPIGAHHKVAMVQGTALRVETIERPMPGELGRVRLVVFKDRPGSVRVISSKGKNEQIAGIVTLDSRAEGITKMWIDPLDPEEVLVGDSDKMEKKLASISANEILMQQMLKMFNGDVNKRIRSAEVWAALDVDDYTCREAWKALEAMGRVKRHGQGRATHYTLYIPKPAATTD